MRCRKANRYPCWMVVSLQLFCWLVIGASSTAAEQRHPDNLDMVKQLCAQVVSELLAEVDFEGRSPVELKEQGNHEAGWIVKSSIESELTGRGIPVVIGDYVSEAEAHAVPRVVSVLYYEVQEITVTYVGRFRRLYVGELRTERLGRVDITMRLVDPESGTVWWSGMKAGRYLDHVPSDQLKFLESRGFPATETPGSKGSFSRYVEPLMATAVVGSLVYLFYTNRR